MPKDSIGDKQSGKRKPGGQPGHPGRTRLGEGRVDRYEILRPQACPECGAQEFAAEPVAVQVQQVAQLGSRPIEIVEYQRHSCQCAHCGQTHTAPTKNVRQSGQANINTVVYESNNAGV